VAWLVYFVSVARRIALLRQNTPVETGSGGLHFVGGGGVHAQLLLFLNWTKTTRGSRLETSFQGTQNK